MMQLIIVRNSSFERQINLHKRKHKQQNNKDYYNYNSILFHNSIYVNNTLSTNTNPFGTKQTQQQEEVFTTNSFDEGFSSILESSIKKRIKDNTINRK